MIVGSSGMSRIFRVFFGELQCHDFPHSIFLPPFFLARTSLGPPWDAPGDARIASNPFFPLEKAQKGGKWFICCFDFFFNLPQKSRNEWLRHGDAGRNVLPELFYL